MVMCLLLIFVIPISMQLVNKVPRGLWSRYIMFFVHKAVKPVYSTYSYGNYSSSCSHVLITH